MTEDQQKDFDNTLEEGRGLLSEFWDIVKNDSKNHDKIAEIKGRISKKIEKLDDLDGKRRIATGTIPDNWDGK